MNSDSNLETMLLHWFQTMGVSDWGARFLTIAISILAVVLISVVAHLITRRIILQFVKGYVKKSKNQYDDIFLEKKVFTGLALLVPALIIYYAIPMLFENAEVVAHVLRRGIVIYMIVVIMTVVNRFLKALESIAFNLDEFDGKPIGSYKQVFSIVNFFIGAIIIISLLIGKSPITIITAFGAATAVLLLVFRDSILGLVASIQISANDMVRIGDWVTVEKYGADGDVLEINLTTVKVRNFDKTITTVPTYAFISDSFRNWRGMQELGIRRIMRTITIDLNTIKFVNNEMLERFEKVERVTQYLRTRQKEINDYNTQNKNNKQVLINGRHMTNIGVFRNYIDAYLREHPLIANNQLIMVRQLEPTAMGVPLQVYCFSATTVWQEYENLQSFIFDHLLAAAQTFDLQLYQKAAGTDFQRLRSPS